MVYCSNCGKETDSSSSFCSSCGASLSSSSGNNNYNNNQNNNQQSGGTQYIPPGLGGTLTIILILGILWAIGSLLAGLYFAAFGGSFLFYGAGIILGIGILCILGGVLALVSCMFIYKLENHKMAFMTCLIGSIIALVTGGIIIGIIGIVFAFLLNKEQYRFKS